MGCGAATTCWQGAGTMPLQPHPPNGGGAQELGGGGGGGALTGMAWASSLAAVRWVCCGSLTIFSCITLSTMVFATTCGAGDVALVIVVAAGDADFGTCAFSASTGVAA